jgi:hypothetical protein
VNNSLTAFPPASCEKGNYETATFGTGSKYLQGHLHPEHKKFRVDIETQFDGFSLT